MFVVVRCCKLSRCRRPSAALCVTWEALASATSTQHWEKHVIPQTIGQIVYKHENALSSLTKGFVKRARSDLKRIIFLQTAVFLPALHGREINSTTDAHVYSKILARVDQEKKYWCLSAVNRLDIMRALKTKPQSLYTNESKN